MVLNLEAGTIVAKRVTKTTCFAIFICESHIVILARNRTEGENFQGILTYRVKHVLEFITF